MTGKRPRKPPWADVQPVADFVNAAEPEIELLVPRIVAAGFITVCSAPKGVRKTHVAHGHAVQLAWEGKRVLMLGIGRAALEVCLRAINQSHCTPALTDAEVERIAASVARYAPGARP